MARITVTQLARNLADFMNRVAYRGERFTVMRGNREIAEIGPAPRGRPLAELAAVLDALPRLSASDAESFAADLDETRRSVGPPGQNPWPS
jgi:antitoxin (DNA-binding transcriptional repressor) of toxin-antitoxin stability system